MLVDTRPTAHVIFKKKFDELIDLRVDDKVESHINQYKVNRLNAEMSAFLSGDLNKYKFLMRKDLKYKPNALDKERFEFSSLGKTFSIGLDKTAQGYQKKGVIILLLKDIRDSLSGDNRPNNKPNNDHNDDDEIDQIMMMIID